LAVFGCGLLFWSILSGPEASAAEFQATGVLISSPATAALHNATGIATAYPGDAGIERDPHVIFVEDFEEATIDALWQRWETVGGREGQTFAEDVPAGSTGKHSLAMTRQTGSGPQLYRRLKNQSGGYGYAGVFARYYVWLYIYTAKPAGHRIKVRFDDVVVATEYIGPLAKP
jgi:hypothetical protein